MPRDLTPGEIRALKAYCEAELHAPAAQSLSVSTQTLKNHLGAAYRKLDAKKAHSALYRLCMQQGFDPFARADALHSSLTAGNPAEVISGSTSFDFSEGQKGRNFPAQYPNGAASAKNDTASDELDTRESA